MPRSGSRIPAHLSARLARRIELLAAGGVTPALITARRSPALAARCREPGIRHVVTGAEDNCTAPDRLLAARPRP